MSENTFNSALKSILIIAVISMGSCKNSKDQAAQNNLDSTSAYIPAIETIIDMNYSMPDPDEILSEIFIEGFEFNSGIICSTQKADQLFEYNSIALYMGVLMADMTYLVLQEKTNLSIEYFETVVQMSDQLDLKVFTNRKLLRKIERNIDDKDSLLFIFKESLSEMKYELDNSKRSKVLALIYTGTIIETFYLAINNIDNNNSQAISEHILEQYSLIKSLEDFMTYYTNDSAIKPLIEQLDSIYYYMNKCILRDSIVVVQKNEENQLHIKGGNKIVYKMESFNSVSDKIVELRNFITEE